jgi:phenylacetic acid degradation protein
MIYEFGGFTPVVHESAFVHPQAAVTGNVIIGRDVYVGPGAALRGDWGGIVIADGCNVQENCVIHMFPGATVVFEERVHMGHGAIVHGGRIGRNTLIGMNSVVMDDVDIGAECIIGAMSFVAAGMKFDGRRVIVGNPARVVKEVTDEMLQWKNDGTKLYETLPAMMRETWREAEPLREVPQNRPDQKAFYETWLKTRSRTR